LQSDDLIFLKGEFSLGVLDDLGEMDGDQTAFVYVIMK